MSADWKAMYEAERAVVDRCWKALGIETYEQTGGKAIWEIVAERCSEARGRSGPYEDAPDTDQDAARTRLRGWLNDIAAKRFGP